MMVSTICFFWSLISICMAYIDPSEKCDINISMAKNLIEDFSRYCHSQFCDLIVDDNYLDESSIKQLHVLPTRIVPYEFKSRASLFHWLGVKAIALQPSHLFAVNARPGRIIRIMQHALRFGLLSDYTCWVLLVCNEDQMEKIRDKITVKSNSHVMLASLDKMGSKRLAIKAAIHNFNTNRTKLSKIGYWSSTSGLQVRKTYVSCCVDLTGLTLRVATVENPPFVSVDGGKFRGIAVDMIEILAESLNFKIDMQVVADGTFGNIYENGTSTGMLHQLITKQADVALADFAFSLERMQAVEYSMPVGYGRFGIMYRRHCDMKLSWKGYLSVLSIKTWIICLFAYVVLASTLSFLSLFHSPDNPDIYDWRDYWHVIISIATLQGLRSLPKQTCARLLIVLSWYICYVVNVNYSSVLISHLITSDSSPPLNDFNSLITSDIYRPIFLKSTVVFTKLKAAHAHIPERYWREIESHMDDYEVSTYAEGVELAYKNRVGFVSSLSSLLLEEEKNSSFITVEITSIKEIEWSLLLQKNSPYLQQFNKGIIQMHESGLTERIRRKHNVPRDAVSTSGSTKPILLEQMSFPLVILSSGIALALSLLLVEKFFCTKKL